MNKAFDFILGKIKPWNQYTIWYYTNRVLTEPASILSVRLLDCGGVPTCEQVVNITLEQWLGIAVITASFKIVLSFLSLRSWVWILSKKHYWIYRINCFGNILILMTYKLASVLHIKWLFSKCTKIKHSQKSSVHQKHKILNKQKYFRRS